MNQIDIISDIIFIWGTFLVTQIIMIVLLYLRTYKKKIESMSQKFFGRLVFGVNVFTLVLVNFSSLTILNIFGFNELINNISDFTNNQLIKILTQIIVVLLLNVFAFLAKQFGEFFGKQFSKMKFNQEAEDKELVWLSQSFISIISGTISHIFLNIVTVPILLIIILLVYTSFGLGY